MATTDQVTREMREFKDAQFFRADLRRRGYFLYSLVDTVPDIAPEDQFMFEAMIDWKNARLRRDISVNVKRKHR